MDGQRHIGEDAEDAIGGEHVANHQHARHIGRELARVDGVLPKARTNRALLHDVHLGGQRACAQQDREIVGLLHREAAGDLARAAGDGAEDARGRNHLVVEHDGERLADIGRRHLAKPLAAANIELEIHHGLGGPLVKARLGIREILALHHDLLFNRQGAGLIHLRQQIHIGGVVAGVGDEAEFELGGGAKQFLQAPGILQARHLHQHAIIALPLNVGLGRAQSIHAAADDLDALIDRATGLVDEARVRHGHADHAVFRGRDLDGGHASAAKGGSRAHAQLAQLGHDLVAVIGVGDAELQGPTLHPIAARQAAHILFTHDAAGVVAQIAHHGLDHIVLVDFQQDMRPALQIEPQHDLFEGDPLRQLALDLLEGRLRQEARHDDQKGRQTHGDDRGDLPAGKTKHGSKSLGLEAAAYDSLKWGRLANPSVLDWLALGAHIGNHGAEHADLDPLGDFDLDLGVVKGARDLGDHAASGHHRIAATHVGNHVLMGLGALLLGTHDHEIHDHEDDREGHQLHHEVGRATGSNGLGVGGGNEVHDLSSSHGAAPGAKRPDTQFGADYNQRGP